MQEAQTIFGAGLNNRLPAHSLPDGFSQEVKNADLTHGDFRPEKGELVSSTDPGGSQYYYEAGGSWVGGAGFTNLTFTSFTLPAYNPSGTNIVFVCTANNTNTTGADVTYAGPITVPLNTTLQISNSAAVAAGNNYTLAVEETAQGFANANKFIEYADDLYISRDGFTVIASAIENTGANGVCEITVSSADFGKFHPGDVVQSNGNELESGSFITSINTGNNKITLNRPALSVVTTSNTNLEVSANPTRIMDGDLTESFQVGVQIPEPDFTFENVGSASGYSAKKWIANTTPPVPLRYAVSRLDDTGVESGMSTPSSVGAITHTSENHPLGVTISNLDKGKYFLYRIGDTSSIFKLLDYYYHNTSLAFSFAGQSGVLSITNTGMPVGTAYALRWFALDDASSKAAKDSTSTKTTNGVTDFAASTNITLYKNQPGDEFYLQVLAKFPDDDREYTIAWLQTNGTGNQATDYGYLDFKNSRSLSPLAPYEEAGLPPKNIKFLTEVNNFFFAAVDKVLFVSRRSQPNLWPNDAFITFDSFITGLGRRGSELVVFTQFSVYRVFGNSYDSMRKVQIPTTEGLSDGLDRTIAETRGGLLYANGNGIHYYNGAEIKTITKNLVADFALPSATKKANIAGVIDDQYYLLAGAGTTGWKLDLRDGFPKLSKTSLVATNLHYRGLTNRLYSPTGIIGEGADLSFEFQSKDFIGGDLNAEKIYRSIIVSGADFTGSITPVVDGVEQTATSLSSVTDLDRKIYLSSALRGNRMSVKITGTGKLQLVGVDSDMADSFRLSRFDSVTVKYVGTPSLSVKVDGVEKIASTTLSSPTGIEGEATLYFPAMTEGVIPHLVATETEANRIISFQYGAEAV